MDELLLGKLSTTVAVFGNAPHICFHSAGVNVTVRSADRLSCDSRTLRYISHVVGIDVTIIGACFAVRSPLLGLALATA